MDEETRMCYECSGQGGIECGSCSGAGTEECNLGHEHECGECEGRGEIDCDVCNGVGEIEIESDEPEPDESTKGDTD